MSQDDTARRFSSRDGIVMTVLGLGLALNVMWAGLLGWAAFQAAFWLFE
jgi:hypothetical protein